MTYKKLIEELTRLYEEFSEVYDLALDFSAGL